MFNKIKSNSKPLVNNYLNSEKQVVSPTLNNINEELFDLIQTIDLVVSNTLMLSDSLKISIQSGKPIILSNKNLEIIAPKLILQNKSVFDSNYVNINTNFKTNGQNTNLFSNKTHILDSAPKIGTCSTEQIEQYKGLQFMWSDDINKIGFFGFNKQNKRFIYIPETSSNDNNIFTGIIGDAEFNKIYLTEIISESNINIKSINCKIETSEILKINSESISLLSNNYITQKAENIIIKANNCLTIFGNNGICFSNVVDFNEGINVSQTSKLEELIVNNKLIVNKVINNNKLLEIGDLLNGVQINGNLNIDKIIKFNNNSICKLTYGIDKIIYIDDIKRIYIVDSNTEVFTIILPTEVNNTNYEGYIITIKNLTVDKVIFKGIHKVDENIILKKGDSINLMSINNESYLNWIKI